MIYVNVNNTLYPAEIHGQVHDREWDNRESKAITMSGDYATVDALFQNGTKWSIVMEENIDVTPVYQTDEEGNILYTQIDVTPQYNTDENGEVLLDDEGNPIPYDGEPIYENGDPIPYTGERLYKTERVNYPNSEFTIRGDITVHTNGNCTVKMGKLTATEILQAQLANTVTEEELTTAYEEGVNSL